jgi:uncharacterized protein
MRNYEVDFYSFDGMALRGTFSGPEGKAKGGAVLVHGANADRDEYGIYSRLAEQLSKEGIASFRFDLRSRGKSEGRREDLTFFEDVNDVRVAVELTSRQSGCEKVHVLGTSYGGGISAYFVSENCSLVKTLVLFCPLLDFKYQLLEGKHFWENDRINDAGIEAIRRDGYLLHRSTFRMGRALINELYHVRPHLRMADIQVPTLTIHGKADALVPGWIAEKYHKVNSEFEFIGIENADHGFSVRGDEDYTHPQTREWQSFANSKAMQWMLKYN